MFVKINRSKASGQRPKPFHFGEDVRARVHPRDAAEDSEQMQKTPKECNKMQRIAAVVESSSGVNGGVSDGKTSAKIM
jgi:hypothetical protein